MAKKKAVKIKQVQWYGFDHKNVEKKFEDNPRFCNYMTLEFKGGQEFVGAVYYVDKPNRELKHKNYLILFQSEGRTYVTGMDYEEIAKFSIVNGVLCKKCNTALYSLARHHFNQCDCSNGAMVDGGRDYERYGAMKLEDIEHVRIDLLTGKVTKCDV